MPRPARRRRVVITGLGVVAPNGIGKDAFWEKLVAGESAVDRITAFDASSYKTQIAAEVKNFDPTRYISSKRARQMWRFSQFAVASAVLAVQDARLDLSASGLAARTAVYFGTSVGGMGTAEDIHAAFLNPRSTPGHRDSYAVAQTVLDCPPYAATSQVALELGTRGAAVSISSNCCTGLDVVHAGRSHILSGASDLVIVGACEAPIFPMTFTALSSLGLLSTSNDEPTRASRPYDRLRDGLVLSEGGGALVLEELDHALSRSATIYAEVTGYGGASESLDMRKTDTTGATLAEVIRMALRTSGLAAEEIDYINAHGSSLPDYDLCDVNGFKAALGEAAYNVPVSSIKSMIGQGISVSGILQAVASCLSLEHGTIPPTINQQLQDPLCDLDFVPNHPRHSRLQNILINAHAIGGGLSALILSRFAT